MRITASEIVADIIEYERRICVAKEKLDALPADAPDWKSRKKLQKKREDLESEIVHVRKLSAIARSALSEDK